MRAGGVPVAALLLISASLVIQASTEDIYWEGEEEASNEFLEVKEHDSSLISHLNRIKRDLTDWVNWSFQLAPTTPPPDNYETATNELPDEEVVDEKDDDADADGSGLPSVVDVEPREKTLRVSFVVMQPYQKEYSDRDSQEFQNFSKSLANAVNKLYEGNSDIRGTQRASLVRIQSRATDDFSCKVTLDIVTTGYDDMDVIEKILRDHIRYRRALENLAVSDVDFSAKVIDPARANDLCASDEIRCEDGICVPNSARCDGRRDCSDGADETDCPVFGNRYYDQTTEPSRDFQENTIPYQPQRPEQPEQSGRNEDVTMAAPTSRPFTPNCHVDQINCDVTRCVEVIRRCDGYADCDDGTDELNCKESCGTDDFRCDNGMCIPKNQRCNRISDCPGSEDEKNCDCTEDEFQCLDDLSCIESRKRCDGRRHCNDASDERDCPPGCPQDQFTCHAGSSTQCARQCDGVFECDDNEDEDDCPGYSADDCDHECDGQCLDRNKICDGTEDCRDGSDEYLCNKCDGPDDFRCTNGECINIALRCNSLPDCTDSSDEFGCNTTISSTQECTDEEFTCQNNRCINNQFYCDGHNDCEDNSDEENCRCQDYEWQCHSGRCIDAKVHCDGVLDCPDNSDELDCPSPTFPPEENPTPWRPTSVDTTTPRPVYTSPPRPRPVDRDDSRGCPKNQWRCENGPCIDLARRCDGTLDCPLDDSDELDCPPNSPPALQLETHPDEETARHDGDVVLQCRDKGPTRTPVRWIREGGRPLKPGYSDRNGRLELSQVTVADSGVYICQAPRYLGTPGAEKRVTLNVLPPVPTDRNALSTCLPHEATCGNGQCIPKSAVCNGIFDCRDRSDEETCNESGMCEPNQFRCDNRRCVLKSWRCDADDDCGDGSDERDCGIALPGQYCLPTEFTCASKQCIPKSFRCDLQSDCMDKSDELGCFPAFVSKTPTPPYVNLSPGETLNLECVGGGVPLPLITWRLNWGHVPEKCISKSENGIGTLTCPNMQPDDSGAYSCEALSARGTDFGNQDAIVYVNRTSICANGFFNSEARSPSECIRCFCFGESTQCKSADLFIYNMPTPLGQGGTRLVGVKQTYNNEVQIDSQPITEKYYYQPLRNGATVTKLEDYGYPVSTSSPSYPYLTLPESYNGNQLTSYGGYIRYKVSPQSPRPSSGYDNMPDIIIKGKFETLVYKSQSRSSYSRETYVEARLTQDNWQKSKPNGLVPATREDIMMALDNVESILLRASVNDVGVNITDFVMESAQDFNAGLGTANLVEECSCPPGYEGLSCQKCSSGYVRENSGPWLGTCVRAAPAPCPAGSYGEPGNGVACQPCPCPLTNRENQFARTCSLGPRGNVICDCAPGYEGEQCQYCAPDYTGNPLVPGDSCQRKPSSSCNPAGTLQVRLPDECLCKDNVHGRYCDQCKGDTFHLSEENRHGCALCFCSGVTGQCTSSSLRRKTTTVTYNMPQIVDQVNVYESALFTGAGVERYDAPVEAAARPQLVRGQLTLNAVERSRNIVYYWSLPRSFAGDIVTSYGGYLRYVLRNVPVSGPKNNAPNIQLISENRLTFHYFGNFEPSYDGILNASVQFLEAGWQRADGKEISRQHFLLALADVKAILVKATYTSNSELASLVSSSIDTADPYGDGPPAVHVEQCVCPVGYLGTSCEDCAPGYTRSSSGLYLESCEPCSCGGHSDMCDPETGVCIDCQDNTAGYNCELCKTGYQRDAYQRCVPSRTFPSSCNCDPRGEAGPCNDQGKCMCKPSVEGDSCDQCRFGTFGLEQDNPDGCTPCYCSGVTRDCVETPNYSRIAIPAPIIGENYGNYSITDLTASQIINDHFVQSISESELTYIFSFPPNDELFWSLPHFTGNRLLSYGGNLALTQRFETQSYPTISTPGTDIVLFGEEDAVYWPNSQAISSGESLSYRVPLKEKGWFLLNSRTPASRSDFMAVLKNLKRVLIRATLTRNLLSTSIADVSMDTAGEALGGASATGIESCNCPPGYTGRSCESCTPGFYQNRGRCQQCNCNGHNCHLTSYGDVVCDCRPHYSGVDCSIIEGDPQIIQTTTIRPPPPQSTVTVTISSPTIRIENVGGQVNFTCEARSRMIQGALPVNWTKVDGHLPQGRTYVDRNTGVLFISQVQVSDSGTYICQTSDGITSAQAIASLTVGSNPMTSPTVSIRPSVNEYYEGDRIELECVTTGNPTPQIIWQRASGQPLPLAVNYYQSYLIIPRAKEEDSGEYRCIARNAAGSTDRTAAITVRPRPTRPSRDRLTISPSTPNVVEGQSTNVICTGTASIPAGSIGWIRQDGAELSQNVRSENGVLYIDVARLENQGVYVCQTTSEQAASVPILVTVVPLSTPPPGEASSITVSADSLKIPTGGTGTIDCNPKGYPLPFIKWSKHNNNFGPGTSQRGNTLIISNAQDEDAGYYMCTGSVDGTVVASTFVPVEIETRIPPKVEIWPQGELAVALGGEFEFHCRVLAGVPAPEILWSRSRERPLSPSTHLQPQAVLKFDRIEVNDEGEYICTATNLAGQDSANATLKVRSVPEITLTPGPFNEVNPGEPVEVHCRANGYPEPMVSIKLRADDREIVPASPGIASLRVDEASERDDGDYVCIAASAAGTVAEQFTIRVERGDIGFGPPYGEGSGENDFDINPDQDERSEQDQRPDQDRQRPEPLLAIEGQDATLGCQTSNNLYAVQWRRVGQQLQRYAQQNGNNLIISNATKRDSGQYECVLIDRRTSATYKSEYMELRVMAQPRITLRPKTQTVRPGQSPTVECIVEGDDIQEISWKPVQRPQSRRVQTRGSTLIFRNIEVEDAGRYECFAKNRLANATAAAEVIVSGTREVGPALVAIDQPRRPFVVGENVEVVCRAIRGVRASWERYGTRQHVDQRPYEGGSVLILNSVAESDAGVYRCTGTDSTSSSSDDFNLEIQPGSGGPSYPVNRRDETHRARLGDRVIIPCRHNLGQPVSYEWRSEFSSLPPDVRSSEPNLYLQQVSEADAGTYICTVSNGRTREESRVVLLVAGVVPMFNGNSWLAMKTLEDAYLNFDIEISFKPMDSNGLILYNSQNEGRSGDSIALQLVDSVPQMVLELTGSIVPIVVRGDRPLSLNTWHTVRMSRMYDKVTMNVDDAGPFTAELSNKLQTMELKQPLYIGGVPDYNQLPNVLSRPSGFIGCVGMLILGKQEKDIMMDSIKRYQLTECDSCSPNLCLHDGICQEARNERGYVCLCPAGYAGQNCDHPGDGCRPRICGPGKCTETADSYKCSCPITFTGPRCNIQQSIEYPAFTGSAYLAIKTPETERSLHMSMKIKAMSPVTDGIIMYCAESELGRGGFIALIVRDGRLEFRYQLGDGSSPVILPSRYPLPANEWTEVNISRTVSVVLLRVNQNYDVSEGKVDSSKLLRLTTPLYVGGVDDSNIILNQNTGVTGGFSGCIKDVTVQAGPVNIVTASIESNNVTECTHYERGDIPEERPGLSPQQTLAPLSTRRYGSLGYGDPCREQPCRNRGTCRPDSSSRFNYTCDCPLGFAGTNCQMPLQFRMNVGFDGNGYLEIAAENLHYNVNPVVIAVTINSRSDNGVILYHRESAAHPSSGDFILLRVENGHVVFEWDQGDGAWRLAVENVDVSDGLRHNIIVKMNMNNREVDLTVDQTTQTETYDGLAGVMHADSNIYLGGIPERLNINGHPGLTGCIVSLEFTDMGRSLDLFAASVAGRNVQRCKEQRRF